MALSVQLQTGTLTLHLDPPLSSYQADDLFGFAQRRNPKRAFLFVSKVLGRHIPVAPSRMRAVMDALAARIPADLPGPIVVIGMAETAISLGAGVQQALSRTRPDSLYLCTTRHPLPAPISLEFKEEHSHATQQVLHYPQALAHQQLLQEARSLVLVDDEASTGQTFANLVTALQDQGKDQFERIIVTTLTDWSAGQAAARLGSRATQVALLAGQWQWQANQAPPLEMPAVDVVGTGAWQARCAHDWGRLGVQTHTLPVNAEQLGVQPHEHVLVLGTGEFVWPPFLLAESLEQMGISVDFSATTRSPIALGHSIQRSYALQDNYGQGIANFLYNVDPSVYDRIFLCTETPAALLDADLLAALQATVVEFYP
ncbi:phosphoribosyltransferase domain-containing protein [Thiothrix eikelboomii]|uniref:TRSP domain C terminus to PRTase_2 n=1 Tax=Thiothrix eikelboomii TaxID=92487 RepID=A0A1T4WI89_9GAMM|nr:phosphoribosyltransferase domain-containing protein [Thiothrix eikelboomii]SKA77022.1 TRSP domain C terminus to PRTase_2 [Thiothrix eikelboomii]